MKRPQLLFLLAGLIAAGVFFFPRGDRGAPAAVEESRDVRRLPADAAKYRPDRQETGVLTDPARAADAAAIIEHAAVTYTPAGVRIIRPFLQDPDPAIRRAARDGLVQLGEADAIPFLRDAALRAEDPEETASLREAADLLALPAWSDSAEAGEVVAEILGNEGQ